MIKRFKYDNKRSARSLFFKEEAIKWDDSRLVYEIPQNETTQQPADQVTESHRLSSGHPLSDSAPVVLLLRGRYTYIK